MKLSVFASMVTGCSAFVVTPSSRVTSRGVNTLSMDARGMVGASAPLGYFDPLGYSSKGSQADVDKLREAELKHGRIAMLASLGYVVQQFFHPFYDGKLSSNPLVAESQAPIAGKIQILLAIGVFEFLGLKAKEKEGYQPGDLLGMNDLMEDADESWKNYQLKELNNGRLAMIAIMGMMAQTAVTGQGTLEQIASGNGGALF